MPRTNNGYFPKQINELVFVTETNFVSYEVGPQLLNIHRRCLCHHRHHHHRRRRRRRRRQ